MHNGYTDVNRYSIEVESVPVVRSHKDLGVSHDLKTTAHCHMVAVGGLEPNELKGGYLPS